MSAWAKPGVKCVCVRTAPEAFRVAGAVYPVVGEVYTVRKVVITTIGTHKGEPAILLVEIVNSPVINSQLGFDSSLEAAMAIDAFRPLVTKSQSEDVALFAHYLDGVRIGEPVE